MISLFKRELADTTPEPENLAVRVREEAVNRMRTAIENEQARLQAWESELAARQKELDRRASLLFRYKKWVERMVVNHLPQQDPGGPDSTAAAGLDSPPHIDGCPTGKSDSPPCGDGNKSASKGNKESLQQALRNAQLGARRPAPVTTSPQPAEPDNTRPISDEDTAIRKPVIKDRASDAPPRSSVGLDAQSPRFQLARSAVHPELQETSVLHADLLRIGGQQSWFERIVR